MQAAIVGWFDRFLHSSPGPSRNEKTTNKQLSFMGHLQLSCWVCGEIVVHCTEPQAEQCDEGMRAATAGLFRYSVHSSEAWDSTLPVIGLQVLHSEYRSTCCAAALVRQCEEPRNQASLYAYGSCTWTMVVANEMAWTDEKCAKDDDYEVRYRERVRAGGGVDVESLAELCWRFYASGEHRKLTRGS